MTRTLRLLAVLVALLLGTGLLRPAPASADEPGGWYDGGIKYTQVVNCFGLIQGTPYVEAGAGAYAGYWADPDSGVPAVGQTFWIHYAFYGMGNPCSGGTYFYPTISLPSGVTFDTSQQIRCGYDGSGGAAPQGNCPGWGNLSGGSYYNNQDSGLWGVAQGHHWEFQFPVKATQPLSGATLQIAVKTIDGNNDATLNLQAPIYVFGPGGTGQPGSPHQVLYDTPSTVTSAVGGDNSTPTRYGFYSSFQAITNNTSGTMGVQLSQDQVTGWTKGIACGSAACGSHAATYLWTDWDEPEFPALAPGATYYWRGFFTPTGGSPTYGAWQSFTVGASGSGASAGTGPLGSTGGGAPGGLSGSSSLGGAITAIKASATVKAKPKGKLRAGKRGKLKVSVTSARGATGTVTVTEKGKVVGTGTLAGGTVVVRLKKLKAGKHKLVVSYAGDAAVLPAGGKVKVTVR
ncbi:Ig-like domain-containing protein [Nocardioides nitrophenolicus]|uniref:Ig-like domain-containing protein n=1 Tax=Nocardioides nitrophenolicus TaxID=60489 RepID=UPI00195DD2B3|nr:Ig-like domain-containing protein [Nocardioides nitrophenolicus]MBM7517222.1 hypothetical protein [Nocardioides nitrophenolicus]